MPKQTISFTIEEEQLARVEGLAENAGLNRSITLGLLIDQGMQAITRRGDVRRAAQEVAAVMLTGKPLPIGAFPGACDG